MKTAEARFHGNPKFKDFEQIATTPFEGFCDDAVIMHG